MEEGAAQKTKQNMQRLTDTSLSGLLEGSPWARREERTNGKHWEGTLAVWDSSEKADLQCRSSRPRQVASLRTDASKLEILGKK